MGRVENSTIGIAIAAILSAVAATAHAQSVPTLATPTGRETQITANFTGIYDSNVAGSDAQLAALRGLKLADQLYEPEADFILARPVGAQILFLEGNAGYVFHGVNTILDRQNVDVAAGANAHYARCQEVATAEYSSFQTDLTQVALPVVKNTLDIETYSGNVSCGRQIGLAPSLSISETQRQNSNALERRINSNTFTLSPALAYQQPALGSLAVFGTFTDAVFPNELALGPNGLLRGGYTLYAGGVRYSRDVGARISASATVSYTSLSEKLQGQPGFSGVTYSGDVTYKVSSRLIAHADLSRGTTPSQLPGANYSIDESYLGDLRYLLGARLTVVLSGKHEVRSYATTPAFAGLEITHEVQDEVGLTADYKLNRIFILGVYLNEAHRSANLPGETFSHAQVGVSTRATF